MAPIAFSRFYHAVVLIAFMAWSFAVVRASADPPAPVGGENLAIGKVQLPGAARPLWTPPNVGSSPPPLRTSWEEFRRLKEQAAESAIQELERRFVLEALRRPGGNVSGAAKEVRMFRPNFHELMYKYGVRPEDIHGE